MGIFDVIATLALFAVTVQGADLFQGYLIFPGTPDTCFKTTAGGPTMPNVDNDAPTDCTLVKVSGTEADGFIIEDASDSTKQITFADTNEGTTPTLTATGTNLKFVSDDNELATVEVLTGSSNTFVIDQKSGTATGQDCVTGTLAYTNTMNADTCNDLLFYFELAACTGTNCKACASDLAICSECEPDEGLNNAADGCVACSGITSCTVCTLDGSDDIQCSACSGSNKLESNACVDSDDDSDDDTTTASGNGVILPSTAFISMVTLLGKQIFG